MIYPKRQVSSGTRFIQIEQVYRRSSKCWRALNYFHLMVVYSNLEDLSRKAIPLDLHYQAVAAREKINVYIYILALYLNDTNHSKVFPSLELAFIKLIRLL